MVAACEAAREVPNDGARVLGMHLEGPFLNPVKKGAHDPGLMRPPTLSAARQMVGAGPRMVTLAPELPGAGAVIEELLGAGVLVSAGHSAATYEQAQRAIETGVRFATHLFNAMPPWGHREPALPGAVLTAQAVTAGLIADGIHVHPAGLEAAIRLKGPGAVALTTDMVSAAGAPPGRYRLGSREVISDGTRVCLTDGTLAGGAATMDGLVRLVAGLPGVELRHAVEMAALTPARALGEEQLGRIACGMPADLVLLDRELRVRMTLVDGEVVFRA
jgi:N-acetylglucosamine-6-phosphate deacetylase